MLSFFSLPPLFLIPAAVWNLGCGLWETHCHCCSLDLSSESLPQHQPPFNLLSGCLALLWSHRQQLINLNKFIYLWMLKATSRSTRWEVWNYTPLGRQELYQWGHCSHGYWRIKCHFPSGAAGWGTRFKLLTDLWIISSPRLVPSQRAWWGEAHSKVLIAFIPKALMPLLLKQQNP